MQIKIVNEAGLEEALIGMKFSFQPECDINTIPEAYDLQIERSAGGDILDQYMTTAKKLCKRDGGHNKFLEQIQVWMIIRAPLYFWKQFDTYRVGISKLSKSTMHTLMKRSLTNDDFEFNPTIDCLADLNQSRLDKNFHQMQGDLPQSFLQTRMVNTNYKVLRNTLLQRKGHRLKEWEYFITEVKSQLNNPELLGLGKE